ncbi:MAG: hypothetical protein K1X72_03750 [Pyrinomonadaceae bacterium]|nr:hypothetical protein [Pyrinomonadaceae bacterium]
MKKILAISVIIVLYLLPLAVFAQKSRKASSTKTGRLTINVSFEAEQVWKIDKKDADYSETGQYTSKFTAKYQYSESNKAISHDGFVSITEPTAKSTTGKFTYEHEGKVVNKAPMGGDTVTEEKAIYTGTISEVGTGNIGMADSGDQIVSIGISAFANANGNSIKSVTDKNGTQTDKSCSTGISSITFITISEIEPNSSKPPVSACTARMEQNADITKSVPATPDEKTVEMLGSNWSPLSASGNFAGGNYNFSFKGSRFPELRQKNEDGEVQTYRETLIVEGVYSLTTGSVKTSSLNNPKNFEFETAVLARKSRLEA